MGGARAAMARAAMARAARAPKSFCLLRREASEPILEEVNRERVPAGDKHVKPHVRLEAVYQVRRINVLASNAAMFEDGIGQQARRGGGAVEEDATPTVGGGRLEDPHIRRVGRGGGRRRSWRRPWRGRKRWRRTRRRRQWRRRWRQPLTILAPHRRRRRHRRRH